MENTLESLKVLYVEDDLDIQLIARIALEEIGGFELCTCTSGHEALAQIGQFQPDLLLLDVMMPVMDGPTLLAQLRQHPNAATTPVVFMTARVQRTEVEHYRGLGALTVIAKPFDPLTLAQQLREQLAEASQ